MGTLLFVAFVAVLTVPLAIDFAAHVNRYRIRRASGSGMATWGEDWKASR